MTVTIEPGLPSGTVEAPPSKSCGHRLLIASCLAGKGSTLNNFGSGEDLTATEECLRALGAGMVHSGSCITVPQGLPVLTQRFDRPCSSLPQCMCRESGSTLRFLLPLSLVCCGGAVFTGSGRLIDRGVDVYRNLLEPMGIRFRTHPGSGFTVQGTIPDGTFRIPGNVSSQFVSGLLFALPLLKGDSILEVLPPVESASYISLTLETLHAFGVQITELGNFRYRIPGGQIFQPGCHSVEGDWSNAAPFLALQTRSGSLRVTGLNGNSLQGDRHCLEFFERLIQQGTASEIDLSGTPDLGPVLFSFAAMHQGGSFTGIRRLRLKESDRVQSMVEELSRFQIRTQVGENCFTVLPGILQRPAVLLYAHNDHRIAMALSILCTATGGTITGAEAVRKSYPEFFSDLKALGITVKI